MVIYLLIPVLLALVFPRSRRLLLRLAKDVVKVLQAFVVYGIALALVYLLFWYPWHTQSMGRTSPWLIILRVLAVAIGIVLLSAIASGEQRRRTLDVAWHVALGGRARKDRRRSQGSPFRHWISYRKVAITGAVLWLIGEYVLGRIGYAGGASVARFAGVALLAFGLVSMASDAMTKKEREASVSEAQSRRR